MESPLNPISHYGVTKVKAEKEIQRLIDSGEVTYFTPEERRENLDRLKTNQVRGLWEPENTLNSSKNIVNYLESGNNERRSTLSYQTHHQTIPMTWRISGIPL